MGPCGEVPCVPPCRGGPPTAGATATHSLQGVGAQRLGSQDGGHPAQKAHQPPHRLSLGSRAEITPLRFIAEQRIEGASQNRERAGLGQALEQRLEPHSTKGGVAVLLPTCYCGAPQNKSLHSRQDPHLQKPKETRVRCGSGPPSRGLPPSPGWLERKQRPAGASGRGPASRDTILGPVAEGETLTPSWHVNDVHGCLSIKAGWLAFFLVSTLVCFFERLFSST